MLLPDQNPTPVSCTVSSSSLIVLDIGMPKLDGFGTPPRKLARRKSSSKIVLLTAQDDDRYISEALRVGARGYVMEPRLYSDLIPSLNLALNRGIATTFDILPARFWLYSHTIAAQEE